MAGYLVFDIESIPDGDLIARTKYPDMNYTPAAAIQAAHLEALADSDGKSDFIPLTYQSPVSVGLARLTDDLHVKKLIVLNGAENVIAAAFWDLYRSEDVTLVSFNGRTFDLPVLELMAFKHAIRIPANYWAKYGPRNRYGSGHIDLMDFIGNTGAHRVVGGLDLLAKLLGRTGKTMVGGQKLTGNCVYDLYQQQQYKAIDDYCIADVLDTYAIFIRTRILTGEITTADETRLLSRAKQVHANYLVGKTDGPEQRGVTPPS